MFHPTNNKTMIQKAVWHTYLLAGSLVISVVFGLILRQKVFYEQFLMTWGLTFLQLEIFIWLGAWFFKSSKADSPDFKKRIVTRLLTFYMLVLIASIIFFLVIYAIQYAIHFDDFSQFFITLRNMEMKGFFIATFIGFTLGAVFFFYIQWTEAVDRAQKLREEKLIFQYETLKSQVNPHFLFNSLNSLSSLLRKDLDLSEQYIQKLSTIYRYILENENKELVTLSAEIEFVKNYFYLQKIRDEEKIELKIELNVIENIQILPVSLQLLVENALKHNSATRKQPLEIVIHFEGLDKIVVRNNLQKKTQLNGSSKIGLKNLNERSRLILNREIEVLETADEFVVKIPVKTEK
jgi:sensor histidine kinase YesM